MKSRNIRIILVLAVLVCAGIVTTQVYWVQQAHALNEERFDLSVQTALRHAADALRRDQARPIAGSSLIEQPSTGCYLIHINAPVPKPVLEETLAASLAAQDVVTDFRYQLSASAQSMPLAYSGYYHMRGSGENAKSAGPAPPPDGQYFLSICFPHRQGYVRRQMLLWMISSIVLLLAMGFLGYLMYVIFRQRRLSEVQRDFVANMTHEFKTPLASIRLGADVLKNPNIVNQPQRLLSYATIISNEAMQLTTHVDRILQMAKAESEGLQLNRSNFAWQDLLRAEMPRYAQLAEARGGSVSLQLPDKPIVFTGDAAHLKSAVFNLVDNAVKYSLSPPVVQISLQHHDGQVLLAVRDHGIGIDQASQRHIFDRFFRVHTGNVHDVKGFGIGLNYVRIIAHAHGGEVICVSKLGKGSTFTLILPLS
jgi:two-component system phosphate regulon sensor histidine kinase PhoR